MSPSAVPIFGLVRDFLLCPHKANYGKATLPPVLHEASLIRTINSLTRKEGALLTSSSLQSAPPPFKSFHHFNTWALEGINFQHEFWKGSKFLRHIKLLV